LCKIDGEPVHVPIPDTFDDDEKERYLTAGESTLSMHAVLSLFCEKKINYDTLVES